MNNSFNTYFISCLLLISVLSCSKDSQILNLEEEQKIEEEQQEEQEESPTNTSSFTFEEPQVSGNTFYVDPINGSSNGDGSESNPWGTLQEIVEGKLIETYKLSVNNDPNSALVPLNEGAPVKGGDRIILKNGYHGQLEIGNFYFNDWLTIEAAQGEKPTLARLHFNGLVKNVYLKNLNIIRDSYQGNENYWQAEEMQRNGRALLYIGSSSFLGNASHIKISGLTAKVSENVTNWSRQDWEDRYADGVRMRDLNYVEIVDSTFENVGFGAIADYFANNVTIVNTIFKNYCRDGIRLTAHDFHFENNLVIGVVNINTSSDNAINFHYDALQAFSRDENDPNAGTGNGIIKNAIIRGNSFIGRSDLPLTNGFLVNQDVQGIGMFDGFFDNFIIENNVVSVSHHHGITLLGATNTVIANNTVIDSDPSDDLYPWIRIGNHKNSSPSQNGIIANNIISQGAHIEGNNVVENTNYIIGAGNQADIYSLFIDPDTHDFHLSSNATVDQNLINAGVILDNIISTTMDKDGKSRIDNPDIGAFERID